MTVNSKVEWRWKRCGGIWPSLKSPVSIKFIQIWFSNGKRSCRKGLPMSSWPKLNENPKTSLIPKMILWKRLVCLRWRMIFYEVCPWLWDWIPKSANRGKTSSFERKTPVVVAESSPIKLLLQESKENQQSCIRRKSQGRNHGHFLQYTVLRSSTPDSRVETAWIQY